MPPNYSGQNLRGRSFKYKNLEGANFSGADIRGADFMGANLKGANFSNAKAGLQRRWVIVIVIVSLLLVALSGLISALAGVWILVFFSPGFTNQYGFIPAAAILFVYVVFFLFTIRQSFTVASASAVLLAVVTSAVVVAVAGVPLVATVVTPAVAAVAGVAVAVAVAAAGIAAGAMVMKAAVARLTAVVVAVATALQGTAFEETITIGVVAKATAVAVAVVTVYLGIHLAWRALAEDEEHTFIRTFAIAFAAIGGTSFRGANLINANFTQATLKGTDFRGALLARTCWYKAKMLGLARVGMTYLEKLQVRQLVITGQGQDKNFDHTNLRGVYLQGANLVSASFIGSDLSEANLQDADLSRARLVQTLLHETDFTGATLTGAYVEDWGITNETKFDGVRCEYVYMRLPTPENPDPQRKPDNHKEVFADGEFGDFIKPIIDTLDLYHNQGVDPRAIAVAFKELAENNSDAELEIVAIERRGEDKILLRANTATTAERFKLSKEYFINYNQLKALAQQDFKALIAEKDSQIRRLEHMIITALERPSFYSNIEQVGQENLGFKFLNLGKDSAIKFLELVGAKIKYEDERSLKVEAITGNFSSLAPLPVLLTVDTPTDQDVIRLIDLSEKIGRRNLDRAGLLLYRKPPDTTAKMEMAKVRLRDRFVLIPIPMALVEQALPDKLACLGLLEEYIERYYQRVDFFDDRNAISDAFSFFGRSELMHRLGDDLIRKQSIGLFGLRKSGKTSVLLQLGFLLREYPVVHIDLQRYGGSQYGAALFNDILQRLYTLESEVKIPHFEPFPQDKPAAELSIEFIRRVSEIAHALQGSKYKLPILCFLDEVERIIPNPEDNQKKAEEFNACFGVLRVLSQEQRQLALLVADVHPDCNRINRWEQEGVATNPVFKFFKEEFLPPFLEEDTQEMLTNIGKLMGLDFDKETLKQIHQQSGGHPFVSRQLARFLTKKIKEENVKHPKGEKEVIEWSKAKNYLTKSLTHTGELKNYLEQSIWKDLEKRHFKAATAILQVLATNENLSEGITEQALLNQLRANFTPSQFHDACDWLKNVGLLYHQEMEQENFYRIRMPLLSLWIQMQMTDEEIEQCKIC